MRFSRLFGARRMVIGAVLLIAAAGAAAASAVAVNGTSPVRALAGMSASHSGVIKPVRVVHARSLPRLHRGPLGAPRVAPPSPRLLLARARRRLPPFRPPLDGVATVKLRQHRSGTSRRLAARTPSVATATNGKLELLSSFEGATRISDGNVFEPPDTQVAVGPTRVVEPVNTNVFVYDRGGNLIGSFDGIKLMDSGSNVNGADPRIVYDSSDDRWLMTMMICQGGGAGCSGSWTSMGVDLAVSTSGDPLGGWVVYHNLFSGSPWNDTTDLQDQPKLGISNDKLTVADNVYNGSGEDNSYKEEVLTTYNLSQLIAGQSASYTGWYNANLFDMVPSIPTPDGQAGDEIQYVLYQNYGSLGVDELSGVPGVGSGVTVNAYTPTIGSATAPVDAYGMPSAANADYTNNLTSVTVDGNNLWTVWTNGCDSGAADCTRLDQVNVSTPTSPSVSLDQNIDPGSSGYYVYPSVTQSCNGDVHVGATYSSNPNWRPTVSDVATRTPGSNYSGQWFFTGDTAYTGSRWGDYSSTVQDPSDCSDVWTAQEYGGVGSGSNWATGIGQTTFASPSLSYISPYAGTATGGTTVDIYGEEFVNGGTTVDFGSTPARSVTFIDATHIQAVSPGGSGTADITVTTANGTTPTWWADQFQWVPAVTGVSPSAGPTGGGGTVTISGAGFKPGGVSDVQHVYFGSPSTSTAAPSFTVTSDSTITATAPAGAVGTVDVTLLDGSGNSSQTSNADHYTYAPQPVLTGINPGAGPTAGGTAVTLSGSGFSGATAVSFGGTAASFSVNNDGSISATTPAQSAGRAAVTVTTPGGTSTVSSADYYDYDPVPTVTDVNPGAGPTAGANTVTISGTGFTDVSAVDFGSNPASWSMNSSGAITATAPPHTSGTVDIRVITPGGVSSATTADDYRYDPVPVISAVSPAAGPTAGTNTVTITGSGFSDVSAVDFGSNPASWSTTSAGAITATVPAHAAGTVDIRVLTAGGLSAASAADNYSYDAVPVVSSLSPAAGPTAGTNTVTISGTGFTGATRVSFGTSSASFSVTGDGTVTATAPAHAAGTVDVTVTTPGGTSASATADQYTYDAPPAVSSITPLAGPTTGGTTVTINGSRFVPGSAVSFGGQAATSVSYVSTTQLTAVAPAQAATQLHVRVTTPGGMSTATGADVFTYGPPAVTRVSPAAGPTAGANVVTISGARFVPGSTVSFGSTAASAVTYVSASQLTATVPTHAAGAVDVTVSDPAGTSSAGTADRYVFDPRPAVGKVVSNAGSTGGGNTVVITGTGFLTGATVHFGGTSAPSVTFVSSTQLKAVAPAHATGAVDVTVTTPGGVSATSLADHYTYGAPTISSFTPASGITGSRVTISGAQFVTGSTLEFAGHPASVTYVSPTQLRAVVPNGAVPGRVSVTTPAGSARSSTVFTPTLSITSFTPASGSAGTVVTIRGVGFNPGTTVSFDGVQATKVGHISSTELTATVPSTASTGRISAKNASGVTGTVQSASPFTKT